MGKMDYMVCLATLVPAYAKDSGCIVTTFHELKYAHQRGIKFIPVKMFKGDWPHALEQKLMQENDTNAAALVAAAFLSTVSYHVAEDWAEKLNLEAAEDPVADKLALKVHDSLKNSKKK